MVETIWGIIKEHPIITAFAVLSAAGWMVDSARDIMAAREFLRGPDPFLMDEEEYREYNQERFSRENL